MSLANDHAKALLNNVVEVYQKQFEDENSYESLLFFFMLTVPNNPESHTIVSLRSTLNTFRQKYFHKYLHYRQDSNDQPFLKAFQTFDELKDPKKKHYVDLIHTILNMWSTPLLGGHANGEHIIFSRPDNLVSKWCLDEVQSLWNLKHCQFCSGTKQNIRSLLIPIDKGVHIVQQIFS